MIVAKVAVLSEDRVESKYCLMHRLRELGRSEARFGSQPTATRTSGGDQEGERHHPLHAPVVAGANSSGSL